MTYPEQHPDLSDMIAQIPGQQWAERVAAEAAQQQADAALAAQLAALAQAQAMEQGQFDLLKADAWRVAQAALARPVEMDVRLGRFTRRPYGWLLAISFAEEGDPTDYAPSYSPVVRAEVLTPQGSIVDNRNGFRTIPRSSVGSPERALRNIRNYGRRNDFTEYRVVDPGTVAAKRQLLANFAFRNQLAI